MLSRRAPSIYAVMRNYLEENIQTRESRLATIEREERDLAQRRERLASEKLTVAAELGVYREMLAKFDDDTKLSTPWTPSEPTRTPSPSAFTMSQDWVTVFLALDARGKSFDAAAVESAAEANSIKLTMPSIRSQFAHYTEGGYLRKISRGKYAITPKGREKFHAAKENLGSDPKENGPPKGSPETGVSAPIFNVVNGGKENA